ncbi:MAG TPA: 6-carboxytetrahydropterin synthase [bacterium]|nr:6-carboxytetrahydropterin synthase [bacterium]
MKKTLAQITKEITFEAAHYLHNPKWDRARNLETFRKCSGFRKDDPRASHYPHGHSYRLAVTVQGPIQDATGFVIDFRVLKEILQREVFARFDHRFINKEVEPFKSSPAVQPTAENMAKTIWDLLESPLRNEKVSLKKVVLWETPDSSATYRGGKKG